MCKGRPVLNHTRGYGAPWYKWPYNWVFSRVISPQFSTGYFGPTKLGVWAPFPCWIETLGPIAMDRSLVMVWDWGVDTPSSKIDTSSKHQDPGPSVISQRLDSTSRIWCACTVMAASKVAPHCVPVALEQPEVMFAAEFPCAATALRLLLCVLSVTRCFTKQVTALGLRAKWFMWDFVLNTVNVEQEIGHQHV